jgi:co-chaperonin GroES (HSP10)
MARPLGALVEEEAVHAVRVALHMHRPPPHVVEDTAGDVDVVRDQVALGQPELREEDLVGIGHSDLAPSDPHHSILANVPSYPSSMLEDSQRPAVTLEPLDDYVVVEPSDDEAETRHGLIIPASAEAGARTGIVTAVGTDPGGVEPGDKVLFPRDAGFDVRLAGTATKVVRRGELIARVHD